MNIMFESLMSLLPVAIVGLTILILILAISLKRSYKLASIICIVGLNVALLVNIWQFANFDGVLVVNDLFKIDGFGLFNQIVVLIASLACVTLSLGYFDRKNSTDNAQDIITQKEELYVLMMISVMGAMMMTTATHFMSFFVSLELLSVPMYGMLAYQFFRIRSLEAGIKYLILSAVASATLLMGMALVFASTGSMHFKALGLKFLLEPIDVITILGLALMVVSAGFKLSLAPFHVWAGDVYQGAPVAVTAFLASVGKVAVMALFVRFLIETAITTLSPVNVALTAMIVLSVLFGNLLALYQTSLKRMLAFSSVAHMGYALMMIVATEHIADTTTSLYMAVYALSSIGAFGVIVLMSRLTHTDDNNEADDFLAYRGLFWRRPVLTTVMLLMLLSMAGIPITAGFITKVQVMFATVQGGRFGLSAMLIIGSAIGLYYYLKVILMMFKRPDVVHYDAKDAWASKMGGAMLVLIAVSVFLFGTFLPQFMIYLSSLAVISP